MKEDNKYDVSIPNNFFEGRLFVNEKNKIEPEKELFVGKKMFINKGLVTKKLFFGTIISLLIIVSVIGISNNLRLEKQEKQIIQQENQIILLSEILSGGRWVCIAENCTSWAYGDDWITNNCRPEGIGDNTSLVCNIEIDGKNYNAPLNIINLSNVRSCEQYDCVSEVYVKGMMEVKK